MLLTLILLPAIAGLLAFVIRDDRSRRGLLPLVGLIHAGMTIAVWIAPPHPDASGWLYLDAAGRLFLGITSALYLAASFYAAGYLAHERRQPTRDIEEGLILVNAPQAVFVGCMLLFLASMTFAAVSHHLGLLWVAIETTTLATAPLIYFHRHKRSLEATWKYLLLCSVGIAIALLANISLAIASQDPSGGHAPMVLERLLSDPERLQVRWVKVAFIFALVGYGTKMGLAPMHSWLPDAHSEAPSVVSALLSGALLNCAMLGIWRVLTVLEATGHGEFGREMLLMLGITSVAIASVFILRQADFKRMLAYSSVEHMGLLAIGLGLGGEATKAMLFHAVNHSLTKAALFMVAGSILTRCNSKSTTEIRGLLHTLPISGVLWIAGTFAIVGAPPFGVFASKLGILREMFARGHWVWGAGLLTVLAAVFTGMVATAMHMAQGRAPLGDGPIPRERVWAVVPPLTLLLVVFCLGIDVPDFLLSTFAEAASTLGAKP